MTTQINGCAFCRSRHLQWSNHSIEGCSILAKHQCTYCKEFGHTNSRCPKSLLKRQKEEEWKKHEEERRANWEAKEKVRKEENEKQANFKANCWASVAAKNIPSEISSKIVEEERILKEQSDAKRKAEAIKRAEEEKFRKQAAKERWERNYVYRMKLKYGLKDVFVVPSNAYCEPDVRLSKGEFWYFKVEGKSEDHEIAKKLREIPINITQFHMYLKEKYWVNWLHASECTEDDCSHLWEIRRKKDEEEEMRYYEQLEREKQWEIEWLKEKEEDEKKEEEMDTKLASGEISRDQYNKWKWQKLEAEWDEEDNYQEEGLRIVEQQQRYEREMLNSKREWQKRKEAREKL
jgi:hypothetical protein